MVPKNMLNDSFVYEEFEDEDRNGVPIYKDPVEVEHVKFEKKKAWHRDSNEATLKRNGRLFCYSAHTTPFLNFQEKARVTVDGQEYIINAVNEYDEPFSKNRTIYELSVI
jgi:hypothetical protein